MPDESRGEGPLLHIRGVTDAHRGISDSGVDVTLRGPMRYVSDRPIFPPEIVDAQSASHHQKRKTRKKKPHPKVGPSPQVPSIPRHESEWHDTPTLAKGQKKAPWLDWFEGPKLPHLRRPNFPEWKQKVKNKVLDEAQEIAKSVGGAAAAGGVLVAGGIVGLGGLAEALRDYKQFEAAVDELIKNRDPRPGPRDDDGERKRFMRRVRNAILAAPDHPLTKLINHRTRDFKARNTRSYLVGVQAGHVISRHYGTAPRYALEDPVLNAFWNIGENWVVFIKPAKLIGGVPVEVKTAAMWSRTGIITEEAFRTAPFTIGWNPDSE